MGSLDLLLFDVDPISALCDTSLLPPLLPPLLHLPYYCLLPPPLLLLLLLHPPDDKAMEVDGE